MRKPRYYYESNFYHIMVQGDEKKYIFQNSQNKEKYLYYLKHNAIRNDVEIVSYCIMDNHAHMLLFCPKIERISKMMSQCNTSFGLYYSKKRKNVGHVFRDRFKMESIYTKMHLINCIKYIHNNPVKAKICKSPEEYYFSSYRDFSKLDNRLQEIIDISNEEIKDILRNSDTITRFLDDEYSKDDKIKAFKELSDEYQYNKDDISSIGKMYVKLKETCRINDTEVAELLGMPRTSMNEKLKKLGIK
ncbi:MAG: transposase [Clostridia bacterium]|nr:transposase [Clostridia bacterium]